MKKKFLFLALFSGIAIFAAGCNFNLINKAAGNPAAGNPAATSSSLILFYSSSCPHCQKAEQYMDDNKVQAKLGVGMKEVSSNRDNANELLNKAEACKLDTNSIGVPFLWNNGQCVVGDDEIINFFKTKAQ